MCSLQIINRGRNERIATEKRTGFHGKGITQI